VNSISAPTSRIQNIASNVLAYFYKIRESIIVLIAVALGILLAVGLYSPNRELTVALAGTGIYVVTIIIDPLKGILLWLATQPLLERYLNISLGQGIPDLSLTRLAMGLVSVLLLARTAIRQHELRPINKFDVVALLLMVGMMQSAPGGKRGIATIQNIFDGYWIPLLTYFTVRNLVTNRRSVNLVLGTVALVGLYSAAYALYESTTGYILLAPIREGELVTVYRDSGLRILRGIWGSNVGFGRTINLAIPILFYFYLKKPSLTWKFFLIVCLAIAFGGLFVTYKRTAWVAMVVVMFVMQLFYSQFRRLFIVLLAVVVIASVLNWDSISSSTVYTDRVNSQNSTSEDRTEGWNNAIELWKVNPLWGRGFGQYTKLSGLAGFRDRAVESEYLNVLVSAGLVGFVPYVALLLLAAYEGVRHYRGKVPHSLAERELIPVYWGMLVGYAVGLSTSIVTVSDMAIVAMFFAVTGAVLYARSSPSTRLAGDDSPLRPQQKFEVTNMI